MTSPAAGSAHDQPKEALTARPASSTADRHAQSSSCRESATAEAESSWRPVRRCASDRHGITTTDAPARTIPARDGRALLPLSSDRAQSTATNPAGAKNDTAVTRSAALAGRSAQAAVTGNRSHRNGSGSVELAASCPVQEARPLVRPVAVRWAVGVLGVAYDCPGGQVRDLNAARSAVARAGLER